MNRASKFWHYMTDENTMEFGKYRLFKSKTTKIVLKNTPHLGVAFAISKNILNSLADVKPINNRLITISLKVANKMYTLINAHMPINKENKTNPDKVNKLCDTLENKIAKIPQNHIKILMGDFNAEFGKENFEKQFVTTLHINGLIKMVKEWLNSAKPLTLKLCQLILKREVPNRKHGDRLILI